MEFNKNFSPVPTAAPSALDPVDTPKSGSPGSGPAHALKGAACHVLGNLSAGDPFGSGKTEATASSASAAKPNLTPEAAYRDTLRDSLRAEATESVKSDIEKNEGPQIKNELREELSADFMMQNGF